MKKGCLVLGLLVACLGLALPTIMETMHSAGRIRTRTLYALKDLQLGIKNYQVEYDGYPRLTPSVQRVKLDHDQTFESEGEILLCLLGDKSDWNPRRIGFIEPPFASPSNQRGLIDKDPAHPKLVDNWGHTYVILIDTNYDNKMVNPDASNTDPTIKADAPPELAVGVAVFSRGEDGIAGTKDDIVSWRP